MERCWEECKYVKYLFYFSLYAYACMCLCSYVHMSTGTWWGQKRVVDPRELRLEAIVSQLARMLGTELGSSARAVQAFTP